MSISRSIVRIRRRALDAEGGFGMIELMVTVSIVFLALLAVGYTVALGFSNIGLARQRQQATSLANQTMEQVRALPFDAVARGLSNSDLGSDPNITLAGANCVGSGTNYCYGGEIIPRGTGNPTVVPLVPHVLPQITLNGAIFTISSYVTFYQNNLSGNAYRVTVLVTWTNSIRQGLSNTSQVQSLFYSPGGCQSTATHPFAAPCQPFLYAQASADQGHIDLSGTVGSQTLNHASLWLPGFGSGAQVEQISAAQGVSTTSGVTLQLLNQSETVLGRQQVTSAADNDPAGTKSPFLTSSAGAQGVQSLSVSDAGATVTVSSGAGDTASTTSTSSASVSPSQPCPNISGVANVNTLAACSGSATNQADLLNMGLGLVLNSNDLGSATLASVSATTCAAQPCDKGVVYRFTAPNGTMCQGMAADTDGCSHADASRGLGQVLLGGLPPNITAPAGWAAGGGYLIKMTSFSDSAQAEAGIGSTTPVVISPVAGTGQVSYWNGVGYTTCTLYAVGCGAGGTTIPAAAVNYTITLNGIHTVLFSIHSSMTAGGKTTTSIPCSGTCDRTQASATSAAPLIGSITYKVVYDGTTISNLTIHVDLGTLLASASYQAAPNGS